jgi:prepilin-type N-terminal cleavage/methylation domain-containing protein
LLSQQGFSLLELLLAVVLVSVLLYGIGTLMTMASTQSESLTNRIQSEAEINEISFYLKHVLSMGVNVEYIPGADLNNTSGSGTYENTGWVRGDYDFASTFNPATASSSIDTIGFFLRDNLQSDYTGAAPAPAIRYLPTGIYFQRPTPRTYGVLYIDLGQPQSGGLVAISPTPDDLWFGSIVDFKATEAESIPFDVNNPDINQITSVRRRLSSVTFKVTVREYLPKGNDARAYTWCPPTSMAAAQCQTASSYRDVERVIRIVFRNNVIGFSTAQMAVTSETPTALRNVRRPLNRRPFDLIYFLKPSYPSGQLKRN